MNVNLLTPRVCMLIWGNCLSASSRHASQAHQSFSISSERRQRCQEWVPTLLPEVHNCATLCCQMKGHGMLERDKVTFMGLCALTMYYVEHVEALVTEGVNSSVPRGMERPPWPKDTFAGLPWDPGFSILLGQNVHAICINRSLTIYSDVTEVMDDIIDIIDTNKYTLYVDLMYVHVCGKS